MGKDGETMLHSMENVDSRGNHSKLVRSAWALRDPLVTEYYDTEWGVPHFGEQEVFERLTLEVFQAGLSWLTVLRKRAALTRAFDGFDIDSVAGYSEADIERILSDDQVIRNRRKITATITNARATVALQGAGESLSRIIWSHMPSSTPLPRTEADVPRSSVESRALAKTLKRHGYQFIGPVAAYSLMGALGVVDVHIMTSHRRGCSGLWNADGSRAHSPELVGDR